MSTRPIEGLLIVGTQPKCGKTTITAGISAALIHSGVRVQPLKPLVFQSALTAHQSQEQVFLEQITRSLQQIIPIEAESPYQVTNMTWGRMIELCRRTAFPALIECPGSTASTLRMEGSRRMTACDLAAVLGVPILLVTQKSPDVIAQTAPALAFIQSRNTPLVGWVAVETTPTPTPRWDEEELHLSQEHRIPFLGTLSYSPQISLEHLRVGDLMEQTENSIDLLPIQQILRLSV